MAKKKARKRGGKRAVAVKRAAAPEIPVRRVKEDGNIEYVAGAFLSPKDVNSAAMFVGHITFENSGFSAHGNLSVRDCHDTAKLEFSMWNNGSREERLAELRGKYAKLKGVVDTLGAFLTEVERQLAAENRRRAGRES